jgi:ABC-type multidrug transport system permease subunit
MLHIFTGLFNTFTFWHLGNSYIDLQSRLFSIFMTLTISPPLIQQLQPRYLHFRGIYESRESNSKIYSWVAFVISTILPELPYSIVAGSIYFNCWYAIFEPHIEHRYLQYAGTGAFGSPGIPSVQATPG